MSESIVEMLTWSAMSVSVASVVVPVSAVYDVLKHRRASGNLLLYGLLFAQALLWVIYGYTTNRTPIFLINALYTAVTSIYLAAYWFFTNDKKIRLCLGSATLGLVLFIGCCKVLPDRDIEVFILGSSQTIGFFFSVLNFITIVDSSLILLKIFSETVPTQFA